MSKIVVHVAECPGRRRKNGGDMKRRILTTARRGITIIGIGLLAWFMSVAWTMPKPRFVWVPGLAELTEGEQKEYHLPHYKLMREYVVDGVVVLEYEWNSYWKDREITLVLNDYSDLAAVRTIERIDNAQQAGVIGQEILVEQKQKGWYTEFVLKSIVHSAQDNIWRFVYGIEAGDLPPDTYYVGERVHVVIDGNTGAFIKAWMEEG